MLLPTKLPPIELVESIYSYDPNSGILTRKKTGTEVSNNDRTSGYIKVRVGRITTQAARVAGLLLYREAPVGYHIRHINGDKQDNSITNLRKVKSPKPKRTV